ncbi:MAG: class IV adenylate cyclase [Chloroflexota bacterium]
MSENKNSELEVKFYVRDLAAVERKLQLLGAQLTAGRVFEINLRFDTPDGRLGRGMQALRLRQDTRARLTYKGPSSFTSGARLRTEIEFEASDFAAAQAFLEALGFQVAMGYEKYRTTYQLGPVEVVLDELPYGNFVEIEGPDPAAIRAACNTLGLRWDAAAGGSYVALFEALKQRRGLDFRDLSFENFHGLQVSAQDLGVSLAAEG